MSYDSCNVIIDKKKCLGFDKCNKCNNSCILVCWLGFKSIDNAPGEPCNLCGHCIAVCPTGAITHKKLDSTNLDKIKEIPSDTNILNLIKSKRTTRYFSDQPIKKEHLKNIVEVVKYSMTAHNDQDVDIYIITNKEELNDIADILMKFHDRLKCDLDDPVMRIDLIKKFGQKAVDFYDNAFKYYETQKKFRDEGNNYGTYNAPAVILFTAPKNSSYSGKLNCCIAASYVSLYAETLNIGSCYKESIPAAYIYNSIYKDRFNLMFEFLKNKIPEDQAVYVSLLLGYKKIKYKYIPSRKKKNINL